MHLKEFVPPIVVRGLKAIFVKKETKEGERIFNSYESAIAECKSGYEEDSLVTVVYEKTKRYRDALSQKPLRVDMSSLRTFVGLSLPNSGKNLNVLDFGGACGAHYFLAKSLFVDRVRLRWHVVETPKMVNIARNLETDELKFYDNLEKATNELGKIDIVFTSGALQYVPKPYEMLVKLTECGASSLFITRVGLSTLTNEFIVVQTSNLSSNGPGGGRNPNRDERRYYSISSNFCS